MKVGPDDILAFWRAAGPDKWFNKSDAFDAEIREVLEDLCAQGVIGFRDSRLQLTVQSRVVWGRPRAKLRSAGQR